jgi:lactoylglutathione lyase
MQSERSKPNNTISKDGPAEQSAGSLSFIIIFLRHWKSATDLWYYFHSGPPVSGKKRGKKRMKYSGTLLVVRDIKPARRLYEGLLGCVAAMDLGVYVAYTNGIALQEENTWLSFVERDPDEIHYGANDAELYFEEHEIESFFVRLAVFDVELVHDPKEHSWGQRVVRFYDFDRHIIEVGEHMGDVARRFLSAGMTREETARRMEVPLSMLTVLLEET